jgi:DNA-binding CsgD family transcriptional regulator
VSSISEKAVLDLSAALSDLTDYNDLPDCLQETMGRYIRFDWLGLFSAAAHGELFNVTSNPHLPFNWDELYQQVAPYDTYRECLLASPTGQPLIHAEMRNPDDETENYCLDFIKKHTDTVHMLAMSTVNDADGLSLLGLYRTEQRDGYTQEDKQLYRHLGPLLRNASKQLMLYQKWDLKRVAYDRLFQTADIRPVILSRNLRVIDLPLNTLTFLRQMFDDPLLEKLPARITAWLTRHVVTNGQLQLNTGPWRFRVKAVRGNLVCQAYVVANGKRQPMLILKLEKHGHSDDFSPLAALGVTAREIEALSYLPLGYTNHQIAMAMGITVNGVKKHLSNVAQKLDAQGRAETLFRAMKLKESLAVGQPPEL